MSSLKRPAEDALDAGDAQTSTYTAAAPPTHLYVILADEEYDAGLYSAHEGPRPLGVARTIAGAEAVMKELHDAYEAKRQLKEGETRAPFGGLDTRKKKGKLIGEGAIGAFEARVEKWKVSEGKDPATGPEFAAADAVVFASTNTNHYAYTICHSWTDYAGDFGGHSFGAVVLKPSAVPAMTCAKLPGKGKASVKLDVPAGPKDGILVAEERESKHKGKKYLGVARRWAVRDWDAVEAKKGPARKKAKNSD
ncbi:hypothetical protein B0H16DRAFT_1526606 [Mycena metata]|uniref:Uncharacterized protein n=1 Tax=Mycena metata TaxID=1033252 RepID=A0AAD7JGD6_9AGAR|nr:hypothetical protein B0H16DRAFT_1526606 [Mycena metata]